MKTSIKEVKKLDYGESVKSGDHELELVPPYFENSSEYRYTLHSDTHGYYAKRKLFQLSDIKKAVNYFNMMIAEFN